MEGPRKNSDEAKKRHVRDVVERKLPQLVKRSNQGILQLHIPHKRFYEDAVTKEEVVETIEPLGGFLENQKKRIKKVEERIPASPSSDVIDYFNASENLITLSEFSLSTSNVTLKEAKSEPIKRLPCITSKGVFEDLEKKNVVQEFLEPVGGFLEKGRTKTSKSSSDSKRLLSQDEASDTRLDELTREPERITPVTVDLKKLIKELREKNITGFFYYLIYSVPRSSKFFHPYCFRVVPYQQINKKNFLTISKHGVTYHQSGEMQFTPLDEWEKSYDNYLCLIKIKTFALFPLWKCFYMWRKNIAWRKFYLARQSVSRLLFISNPVLQKALLEIQELSFNLVTTSFIDATFIEKLELQEFLDAQIDKKNVVYEHILEFRELVKDIIHVACLGALFALGFTPDDNNLRIPSDLVGTIAVKGIKTSRDGRYRMSYVDRLNKRKACTRLSRFIMVCDIMIHTLFHTIIKNSVRDFFAIINKHYQHLPIIEGLTDNDLCSTFEEPRQNPPKHPMFICMLYANTVGFYLEPSKTEFLNGANRIMKMWNETINAIRIYTSDPYFHIFTQPTFCGLQEERQIGYGVSLEHVLSTDIESQNIEKEILHLIEENLKVVKFYIKRFTPVHESFCINENLDPVVITNEKVLETFRSYLIKYNNERATIEKIVDVQPLGLIYLILIEFKKTLMPSPDRLIELIKITLPCIGKDLLDALIAEGQDASAYLEIEPRTTLHYVEYLNFLDKITARVSIYL
ncbi:dynein axonemal heavy chain 6-like [Lycorma delicatula]|uniref:dynein axonemal heavy chain 6-like n=1 Tax=Lycorma delicatula TaxID=130591 RepID=UPI003F5151CE